MSDTGSVSSKGVVAFFLIALIVLSAGFGLRDPWPSDEPRFALIAKQMVESGEWLVPHRGSEPYPDKPPIFMWSMAASYWLIGDMHFAFLLPSLLAALAVLLLVYDIGRRLWNRQAGLWAAGALLTAAMFSMQAHQAQIDMMLCFWTTLGIYGLLRHFISGPAWRWYYIAFAAMGFGIITKGVGILPVLMFLPWAIARIRRWPDAPPLAAGMSGAALWALGPVMMLLAIGVWLAPMLWHVNDIGTPALLEYRDNILFKQTIERYGSAWHHHQPWWYFGPQALVLWLPLTLLLPWLAIEWKRALGKRSTPHLLLLGWVLLVFVFFSLSSGKRGVYILPALPAFALAAAPHLRFLASRLGPQRLMWGLLMILSLTITAAAAYLIWIDPQKAAELLKGRDAAILLPVLGAGILGLIIASLLRGGYRMLSLPVYFAGLWLVLGWWAYPIIDRERSRQPLMQAVAELIGPDAPLAMVNWKEQLLLHADRPVSDFGFRTPVEQQVEDALQWLAEHPDGWVMTQEQTATSSFNRFDTVALPGRFRREWVLVHRGSQ